MEEEFVDKVGKTGLDGVCEGLESGETNHENVRFRFNIVKNALNKTSSFQDSETHYVTFPFFH